MKRISLFSPMLAVLFACSIETSDTEVGSFDLRFNDAYVALTEVTLLKGRCIGRIAITSKTEEAQTAVTEIARHWAAEIPQDNSGPANDAELVGLVPEAPLPSWLSGWQEDASDEIKGPWLISTNADLWINGASPPFEENGFEAVTGEQYVHAVNEWRLQLELVNQGTFSGAERAFAGSGWDAGIPVVP